MRRVFIVFGLATLLTAGTIMWSAGFRFLKSNGDRFEARQSGEASGAKNRNELADETKRRFFRSVPMFIEPAPPKPFPAPPLHAPSDPAILFTIEDRDADWAPRMEGIFDDYLSEGNLGRFGLSAVHIEQLECRQTTCKLVYEHPQALSQLSESLGLPPGPPLQVLEDQLGPIANRGGGHRTEAFMRNGQPLVRQSLVIGFTEANWNPVEHAHWVSSQHPLLKAVFARYREHHRLQHATEDEPPADHGG